MADNSIQKTDQASQQVDAAAGFANALLPADFVLTGAAQFGVVVEYTSSAGKGQLVISQLPLGDNGAIFITAPIAVKGSKFKALLKSKGVEFGKTKPDGTADPSDTGPMAKVGALLDATTVSLDAFYYGKGDTQPLFVSVSVTFDGGLIDALVNGPKPADSATPTEKDDYTKKYVAVSEIFDITGGSVRMVKCLEAARGKLTTYLSTLQR